ncbi:type 2 lantipeptide synthetase LanM [Streptacidiphilus sp. PB12-B1b]|uniref:type 2 lanthipeptide synthetase LanM family protein n=1 Tax=Streptacidiphilus sp. PB12-B1b TaxID=2705012 RepID=UPI0015FAC141|nr:type 2 lanthipeptide synthetase LanM family protein [Streptacidiphilus sp. PB12-B1b]QMU78111.1 type 2 lantipeptide synthetase LanM [Streptacidiphilus sp. PB12-B1b]
MAAPWAAGLEQRLAGVAGLGERETQVIVRSARRHLLTATEARLKRLFLLELHAVSLGGGLDAPDAEGRWAAFLELAAEPAFLEGLAVRYPTLGGRLRTAALNVVGAVGVLAERLVADRAALDALAGQRLGELRGLALGSGDPHRGGHTVSRLDFAHGTVMYKPRPMEVDAALDSVLAALVPGPDRIRTPAVLARDGYGWTAFVAHRYCDDDAQLAAFYRNLGTWLAVMRLVGGTDLHSGNIVAHGPVPVVVDAETMFSPAPVNAPADADRPAHADHPASTSAAEVAARTLRRAVTRVGILPMRVGLLSGVDLSAVGRLPGEQPTVRVPTLSGGGTDAARLVDQEGRLPPSGNHPSPEPDPERFWEDIVSGFEELSARLRRMDRDGELMPALKPFLGSEIRQVLRSTQVYGDVRQMLWHPAALHNEPAAVQQARAALRRHHRANPIAPGDDAAIDAEIADLLVGDTPVFTAHLRAERLRDSVDDWRAADLALEARLIRYAVTGMYADGHRAGARATPAQAPAFTRGGSLEARRRALAAETVTALRDSAIHGPDGSATWIGPVSADAGWAVRGLGPDLLSGQAGVVVSLAAYQGEAEQGRAEPVPGLGELLTGAVEGLRRLDDRPTRGPGALTGHAGRVWAWLALSSLLREGAGDRRSPQPVPQPVPELLDRAVARAQALRAPDLRSTHGLDGWAGAVVPLLDLSAATGDARWAAFAASIGRGLATSIGAQGQARAVTATALGFAHGRAGTAWALHRAALGAGSDDERAQWRASADRALGAAADAVEASGDAGWCRGASGIGLAACDLYARTGDGRYLDLVRRMVAVALAAGSGQGRSLCHGACGVWELLAAARGLGLGSAELPGPGVSGGLLLDTLRTPPAGGLDAAEATAPGLLNGLAGTALTLLRMHPGHGLGGSPLLLASRP